MGKSTPIGFALKMHGAAETVSSAAKVATSAAALATKKAILVNTPARMSGVGKKGAKLGVRYKVGQYDDGAKALIFATGPFHLIERDTRPHPIPRLKVSGKSKAARPMFGPAFGGLNAKKLKTPYGIRSTVWHPGTKGQHPFERSVAEIAPVLPRIYFAALTSHYAAVFGR